VKDNSQNSLNKTNISAEVFFFGGGDQWQPCMGRMQCIKFETGCTYCY